MDKLPTLEEYHQAEELLKNHRICSGCHLLFLASDTTRTIQYGNVHYWCAPCYEKIKDDW